MEAWLRFLVLLLLLLLGMAEARGTTEKLLTSYKLDKQYSGTTFFDHFYFYLYKDENMEYVNSSVAWSQGLVSVLPNGTAYMGADRTTRIIPNKGISRKSVQIQSYDTWNSGLFITDVRHMPAGCGTWPALWTVGYNWPQDGEIDIIEGVNNQIGVRTTLHTGPHCDMKTEDPSSFTGSWITGTNGEFISHTQNAFLSSPLFNRSKCNQL